MNIQDHIKHRDEIPTGSRFEYQIPIVEDIIEKFGTSDKPYVLASCPSSGKTNIAIEVIMRMFETGKINRVLILPHNTSVLKVNFYERLQGYFDESFISMKKKGIPLNKDAKIHVALPQSIKEINGQYDLVIVDEAHHNYLTKNGLVSRILEKVSPKYQLLLTGTPSRYVYENGREEDKTPYDIKFVGMDMVGIENLHDVGMSIIKSDYSWKLEDYNTDQNLLDSVDKSFKRDETANTINNVIQGVVKVISKKSGYILPSGCDYALEARKLIKRGEFGKTLIMCKSIQQANQVKSILSNMLKTTVLVSESINDKKSEELDKFKELSDKAMFLCVVDRAREGYDNKHIKNLVDLTLTHNVDLIYQMYCRVVRKLVGYDKDKLFIKVTSKHNKLPEYTTNVVTAALMLGVTKNLRLFNGKNFKSTLDMPKIHFEEDDDSPILKPLTTWTRPDGTEYTKSLDSTLVMDLIQVFNTDVSNINEGNDTCATTKLGQALDIIMGENYLEDKIAHFKLLKEHDISNSKDWKRNYKSIQVEGYNLHSNPWTIFDKSAKDFFKEFRIWNGEGETLRDKEEYFKLFKEYDISSSAVWSKKYKGIQVEGYNLHSDPWKIFDKSAKDFFKEFRIWNGEGETLEDKIAHFKLFKKHDISTSKGWYRKYKSIQHTGYKLHSTPWRLFDQSEKDFFKEFRIWNGEVEIPYLEDKIEYFKLFKKHDISNSKDWKRNYKSIQVEGYNLHSNPWTIFDQNVGDFFKEFRIWNGEVEIPYLEDKIEYFKLFKEHKVTGSKDWYKKYKSIQVEGYKLKSDPWMIFDQTFTEFNKEFRAWNGEVEIPYLEDKIAHFKLFKKYDISTSKDWHKKYKYIQYTDFKLKSDPWKIFDQTFTEFNNEYKEWLSNLPVRDYIPHHLGDFSKLNKKWSTMNSKNLHKALQEDPSLHKEYHTWYRECRESWEENHYQEIADKIDDGDKVADLGCGENILKTYLPKCEVDGFDHRNDFDESIIIADISNLSMVKDCEYDVVVLSLANMGSNSNEYLKEAHRILKKKGKFLIIEPKTKGERIEDRLVSELEEIGFGVLRGIGNSDMFIYIECTKK